MQFPSPTENHLPVSEIQDVRMNDLDGNETIGANLLTDIIELISNSPNIIAIMVIVLVIVLVSNRSSNFFENKATKGVNFMNLFLKDKARELGLVLGGSVGAGTAYLIFPDKVNALLQSIDDFASGLPDILQVSRGDAMYGLLLYVVTLIPRYFFENQVFKGKEGFSVGKTVLYLSYILGFLYVGKFLNQKYTMPQVDISISKNEGGTIIDTRTFRGDNSPSTVGFTENTDADIPDPFDNRSRETIVSDSLATVLKNDIVALNNMSRLMISIQGLIENSVYDFDGNNTNEVCVKNDPAGRPYLKLHTIPKLYQEHIGGIKKEQIDMYDIDGKKIGQFTVSYKLEFRRLESSTGIKIKNVQIVGLELFSNNKGKDKLEGIKKRIKSGNPNWIEKLYHNGYSKLNEDN